MAKAVCECRECGKETEGRAAFCKGPVCRSAWHNRRKARGAELYDILMANRFERDQPDTLSMIARLASAYRDADKAKRDGRKSWDYAEAVERLPLAYSTEGDGR